MKDLIAQTRIIGILRGVSSSNVTDCAKAAVAGGVRVIECTFEQDRPDCEKSLTEKLNRLHLDLGTEILLGAGTVLTIRQVKVAFDAGARLIVTPNTNEQVIREAQKLGMCTVIGALTPTEIVNAYQCGANYVKVFPAGCMGPDYIHAVKAPLAHIPLLAVGGITPEKIAAYRKAGVFGFGVGGPLFEPEAVRAKNYGRITDRAKAFCCAAASGAQ